MEIEVLQPDASPLHGLKILDFTWLLPGPFATMMLSELGADVIKIERPSSGDYLRALMPEAFELVNRGKRSVVLDLKTIEARKLLYQLTKSADVIVEGFRPGVMDRLELGFERLKELKSNIIYVSISGYGQTGPNSSLPGHDVNYLAMSGAMSIPSTWGELPKRSGLPIADLAGSMYATINVLAALRQRDHTGKAHKIDISLADSILHWTQVRFAEPGQGASDTWAHISPANDVFVTADGKGLSLALVEQKFWETFCNGANAEELLERFPTVQGSGRSAASATLLKAALVDLIRSRSLEDWCELLRKFEVPFAPVYTLAEAHAAPSPVQRGMVDPKFPGRVRLPGNLVPLDTRRAPILGEDTEAIAATDSN